MYSGNKIKGKYNLALIRYPWYGKIIRVLVKKMTCGFVYVMMLFLDFRIYLINLTVAEFMPRINGASRDGYINAVFLPVSVTRLFVCVYEYFS